LNSWCLATREEGKAIEAATDEIFKRSDGRLRIDVYPQFALGVPWTESLRAMKDDVIEISMILCMYMGGEEPFLNVPEIPGIWKHKEQSIDAAVALEDYKRNIYTNDWGIVFIPWGHMVTHWDETFLIEGKRVARLDDFQGLKIRSPNPRYLDLYKRLGASPQMIPPGEVYMACQTGVVDGYASAACYSVENKLYEVVKYGIPMGANLSGQQDILVSDKAWAALPSDLQKIVQDVFAETRDSVNALSISPDIDLGCREVMADHGLEWIYLPPEDGVRFRELAMEAAEEWVNSEGGRILEAWEIIQPVLKADYPDAMAKGGRGGY